jgi:hypothetical protein
MFTNEKGAAPGIETTPQKSITQDTEIPVKSQGRISLTLWWKQNGHITKIISKDADGELVKDGSQCKMSHGIGQVADIQLHKLPESLNKLNSHHAITLGVPKNKNLPEQFNVVAAQKFKGQPDTITRSLEHMEWVTNQNIMVFIDYDPAKGTDPLTPLELVATIAEILPGFEDVARVTTHSTSSCISDENGVEVTGPGAGYHIYFMMPPGTDVKRFVEIFKVRTWLAGHGYIMLSKDGSMLIRNRLFDEFVFSAERLVFEAGAVIPEGWTQNRPEPVYIPGGTFVPGSLPDITPDEHTQYKKMVTDAKAAIKGQADEIRAGYITTSAKEMHTREPKIPLAQCEATIKKACSDGDLHGDFVIYPDGMEPVTVAEILNKPWIYDGVSCSDPLEPWNTAGKAMIFVNRDKGAEKAVIKSFWHGDHILFLHAEAAFDAEQIFNDALEWTDVTDDNRAILGGWLNKIKGLNSADVDTIKSAVQKKTGVKISILNKDLKKQKGQDEKAKVKARAEETSKKRAKIGIKEIMYHPTQTGECCHKVSKALSSNPKLKIFRLGGNLIKIGDGQPTTVRMVQEIHDKGGEYPSMPIIKHISKEPLCHEIERVAVCQSKDAEGNIKDMSWPKNIVAGVSALTEFHEKPLVGIVPHPYIDDDFKPAMTQGYDDKTGLYIVHDVVPDIEFFKDAEDALIYLIDELFKDFPFSTELDQIAAVGCLLTGMQRKLISGGCPGFGFTAPIQSSGKTALCQSIIHSLHGRPAAATSYSDDDAEMAKHILGILQEGHSAILFDNIAEGSVIESNELAKCITSDTYSNRLLSKNKTATVPCSVLWLMTGNNISVCGDFNTRFLMIELDPKDANPDQRRFKRDDIGAWCEHHRGKILGACMKIIMDGKGYSNPDLKPTRFPSWDRFVRLPLFKTSNIDIAEIFQKNKLADPKIEGQNNFFEAWFNTFGSNPTTTKQVLDCCLNVSDQEKFSGVSEDNDLADAVRDIFTGPALPSTKALGKWLTGMKNRFFGDYKLTYAGKSSSRAQKNKALWVVKMVE